VATDRPTMADDTVSTVALAMDKKEPSASNSLSDPALGVSTKAMLGPAPANDKEKGKGKDGDDEDGDGTTRE